MHISQQHSYATHGAQIPFLSWCRAPHVQRDWHVDSERAFVSQAITPLHHVATRLKAAGMKLGWDNLLVCTNT